MKKFQQDITIGMIYDEIELTDKCVKLLESMESGKPDRDKNGIKTWFKYEESKMIYN